MLSSPGEQGPWTKFPLGALLPFLVPWPKPTHTRARLWLYTAGC